MHNLRSECVMDSKRHECVVIHLVAQHRINERNSISASNAAEANRNQLLQLCKARTAWSESDQAVRAVHSCNSW